MTDNDDAPTPEQTLVDSLFPDPGDPPCDCIKRDQHGYFAECYCQNSNNLIYAQWWCDAWQTRQKAQELARCIIEAYEKVLP